MMMRVALVWIKLPMPYTVGTTTCCPCSTSVAANAIIVKVFPRPMGSATTPPLNCGGSSVSMAPEILLKNLMSVRSV